MLGDAFTPVRFQVVSVPPHVADVCSIMVLPWQSTALLHPLVWAIPDTYIYRHIHFYIYTPQKQKHQLEPKVLRTTTKTNKKKKLKKGQKARGLPPSSYAQVGGPVCPFASRTWLHRL